MHAQAVKAITAWATVTYPSGSRRRLIPVIGNR